MSKCYSTAATAALNTVTRVVRHPGIFHADDVCSLAFLRLLGVTAPCEARVPTPGELDDPGVVVLDIGGRHEPALLNFDHHQLRKEDWAAGRGCRRDGVPYAAFGLLADRFPHPNPAVQRRVDQALVEAVDAADTGWEPGLEVWMDGQGACGLGKWVDPGKGYQVPPRPASLGFSAVIAGFNPGPAATPAERLSAFDAAVEVAKRVIENTVAEAEAFVAAIAVVLGARTAVAGRVLVLDTFVPWEEHVLGRPDQVDLLYVVYPSLRGGFCVQQIPVEPGSFKGRKPLPAAWVTPKPKRGKELAELLGLSTGADATFCHGGRFIAGAETLDDVLKMAAIAVES